MPTPSVDTVAAPKAPPPLAHPKLAEWWPPELLSPGLRRYLVAVDDVVIDPKCPTIATAFEHGRMRCIVSPAIEKKSLAARIESLAHECGHVVCQHHPRMLRLLKRLGQVDANAWNMCCDASIHYSGIADPAVLTQAWGQAVTFEVLKLPPCPPEVAYEMLPTREVHVSGGGDGDGSGEGAPQGCGREQHAGQDAESAAKAAVVAATIVAADPRRFAGIGAGGGSANRPPFDMLPPPPRWVRQIIDLLTALPRRDERRRSWYREHRRLPGVLPGRTRKEARGATFIWDLSGSIAQDDVMKAFAAFAATPELAASDVVLYDSRASERMPLSDLAAVKAAIPNFGGGTAFLPAAKQRNPERIAVWITDGYTGDGWPAPHGRGDVWLMSTDVVPPHGVVIRTAEG